MSRRASRRGDVTVRRSLGAGVQSPPGSRSAAVPAWINVGMHDSSEAGDGAALSHDRLQRVA